MCVKLNRNHGGISHLVMCCYQFSLSPKHLLLPYQSDRLYYGQVLPSLVLTFVMTCQGVKSPVTFSCCIGVMQHTRGVEAVSARNAVYFQGHMAPSS